VGAYLYVWTNFAGLLGSPAGAQPKYSTPWPMFRGSDPRHTGIFAIPELRPSASGAALMVEPGGSARTFTLDLSDAAGGAIDWSATKNQSWISLSNTSGTTPDTLKITIDPSGKNLGTYTGAVSFSSSFGSPKIDVTLFVVDKVYDVYLPTLQR
jgi:hypothetical protein